MYTEILSHGLQFATQNSIRWPSGVEPWRHLHWLNRYNMRGSATKLAPKGFVTEEDKDEASSEV